MAALEKWSKTGVSEAACVYLMLQGLQFERAIADLRAKICMLVDPGNETVPLVAGHDYVFDSFNYSGPSFEQARHL